MNLFKSIIHYSHIWFKFKLQTHHLWVGGTETLKWFRCFFLNFNSIRIFRSLNTSNISTQCDLIKRYFDENFLDLGDDRQALIWDISPMPRPVEDPILAYQAEGEVIFVVCNKSWSTGCCTDWVLLLCFGASNSFNL